MKKYLLLLLFSILTATLVYAQKENNVWNFGLGLRMDFNASAPAVSQQSLSFSSQYMSASVCNSGGNLLFYTDSRSIFDRNDFPMPNANFSASKGLAPVNFLGTMQGVVIVPFYNDTNKFYVFTLYGDLAHPSPQVFGSITHYPTLLSYSIVDMTLNFGFGNIPTGQKRIPLDSNLADKMVAVKGAGCYTWLLVHRVSTKEFLAYKIDASGIHPPVSSFSSTQPDFPYRYCDGAMKVSPDNQKLGVCSYWKNTQANASAGDSVKANLELFHFNRATGVVSAPDLLENYDLTLPLGNHKLIAIYSCAFSPDSKMLYETIRKYDSSQVVQYDIGLLPNLSAAVNSATVLQTADSFFVGNVSTDASYYDLRLAPDNRIYVSRYARQYLERIDLPNLSGTACSYQKYQVSIGTALYNPVRKDLGSDVVSSRTLPVGSITDTTLCTAAAITLSAPSGASGYLWQTGSTSPTISYQSPGTVWVQYSNGGCTVTDTFRVTVTPLVLSLGADTTLCKGAQVILMPTANSSIGDNYLWQDGTTNNQYVATEEGKYWLEITKGTCKAADTINVHVTSLSFSLGADITACADEELILKPDGLNSSTGAAYLWQDGSRSNHIEASSAGLYWLEVTQGPCVSRDSVEVTLENCGCQVFIPSAFSPNGDGLNDYFAPRISCYKASALYHLEVFNRWGERIFYSFRPDQTWDGTRHGIPAEMGTYMYMFTLNSGGHERVYKGDITLVR